MILFYKGSLVAFISSVLVDGSDLVWHKSKRQTDQNEADFVELLHTSATDYKFFLPLWAF